MCSAGAFGCTDPENASDDACLSSDTPESQISIEAAGSWPRTGDMLSFEGWATVERSTPQDWVLYVQAQEDAGDDDLAESAARCTVHARSGHALPRLARGARVWLQLSTDSDKGTEPRPLSGTQLTLRAQEHGALLYSSIHAPGTVEEGLHAAALAFLAPRTLCSRSARCILGGRNVVYSLEARADEPVRVAPGTHTQLMLDGLTQELWLAGASQNQGTTVPMLCGDLLKDERLWVSAEIQANELERVTSQLTQGTLPACKLGNDSGSPLSHGVSVAANGVVEGDAKLRERLDGTSFSSAKARSSMQADSHVHVCSHWMAGAA